MSDLKLISLLQERAKGEAEHHAIRIPAHVVEPQLEFTNGERIQARSLLSTIPRAFVVGGTGAGKTTLLRWVTHRVSRQCAQDPHSNPCALYFAARDLSNVRSPDEIRALVRSKLMSGTEAKVDVDVDELLNSRRLALLIDGVDEISGDANRLLVLEALNDLARWHPDAMLVISTRPTGLSYSFPAFSFLTLAGLDNQQIARLATALDAEQPELVRDFLADLSGHQALTDLGSTPLLLELLFNVYKAHGKLPDNIAGLYADVTDYILSTWEAEKQIGPRSHATLANRHKILERVARHILRSERTSLFHADLVLLVQSALGVDDVHADLLARELLQTGLLRASHHGEITFLHLSFAEYYLARSLVDAPEKLMRLAGRSDAHQVVVFACGMVRDSAPIVGAALERGQLLLAARCVTLNRTNTALINYVVEALRREVGETFLRLISVAITDPAPGSEENRLSKEVLLESTAHEQLLEAWDLLDVPGLTSVEKGRRLEQFAKNLFGQVFRVVRSDLHTESGELDLVVEIHKLEPFWLGFGSDILVECKNQRVNSPLKEVALFRDKLGQCGCKLGFFLSVEGFTEDALRTLRNSVGDSTRPLIVPLAGTDVKRMLLERIDFEHFFKEAIRDFRLLRKY